MKRLALLVVTAVMALVLSACGDNAEKKVEGQAAAQTEESNTQLDNANKDVNKELNDSSDATTTPAASEAAPAAPSSEAAPAAEAAPAPAEAAPAADKPAE
ncbi:hypothetical protein [Legionella sp. CNM-4043-24]|uniref:hypothetical protein n=1 Tax=Legionella sp. CNM-4043-24 TaxID=3421646 RepID=UPI00403AE0AE